MQRQEERLKLTVRRKTRAFVRSLLSADDMKEQWNSLDIGL
jgi:hypothetical protein